MTTIQFLILLLIVAVFVMLIGHMMHRVYSAQNLTLFDCSAMYINFTIHDFCFKYQGAEIDPIR